MSTNPTTPAHLNDWLRVLRDLPPAQIMRTLEWRKLAVGAAWLVRVFDERAATLWASDWDAAGWSPNEWSSLASAVALCEARELKLAGVQQGQWRRELLTPLHPSDWTEWRALAGQIGALRATIAMLDDPHLELNTRVRRATAEVKLTAPGLGRPGPPLSDPVTGAH